MNKKKSLIKHKIFPALIGLMFLIASALSACNHYDQLQKSPKESSKNGESHNAGEDCMRCHHDNKNGASDKWWYVAGTAYDGTKVNPLQGGRVELWTGPGATGTLLKTFAIDKKGNFYTDKIIDFKGGYFPSVFMDTLRVDMAEKVAGNDMNLSCNACHGHNYNGLNTPVINFN